jgi:hypothetical protein
MVVKPVARPELPKGLSPQEEAAWWDAHPEYWDAVGTPDEVVEPAPVRRTRPITIRLPIVMIDALKREASSRAIPYQTLIRMWLKERLDQDRGI